MSRLLSHIKIPFKKADPVLQLVVRFIFIMIANGYITTQFTNIPESILDDNNVSYDDIKDYICKHSSLSQYLITVARDFHIPCLRPYLTNATYPQAASINNINCGSLFEKLPTDKCLNVDEIK